MQRILSVFSASSTQDLASLASAKANLRITTPDLDTSIQAWISRASAAIASACDRVFGLETVIETFFVSRELESLPLARYPISNISSLTIDGGTTESATDYVADKSSGVLLRLSSGAMSTWCGERVEVAYSGGYSLSSGAPRDLEQACLLMVSYAYSYSRRDVLAKRIEVPDVQSVDYWVGGVGRGGELPPDVLSLISPYRRLSC